MPINTSVYVYAIICLFLFGSDHSIKLLLEKTTDTRGKKRSHPIRAHRCFFFFGGGGTQPQRVCSQHSEFNMDMLYPETGEIHNNKESKTSRGMRWKALIDKEMEIINTREELTKRINKHTFPFPLIVIFTGNYNTIMCIVSFKNLPF